MKKFSSNIFLILISLVRERLKDVGALLTLVLTLVQQFSRLLVILLAGESEN